MDELPPGTVTFLVEEDLARRNHDQQKALHGSKVLLTTFLISLPNSYTIIHIQMCFTIPARVNRIHQAGSEATESPRLCHFIY